MVITGSYTPLNEADIKNIEAKLDLSLPLEYQEFLLKNNGGKPSPDAVKYEGEYFDFVSCFYGARFNTYSDDIFRNREEYKEYILPHYLAIGDSPGGDIYCLSLKEQDYGAVYYWDHELANYDGEPWEENMVKLANSLTEFLAGLYSES